MMQRSHGAWVAGILLVMTSLAACSLVSKTPPSTFYVLSPRPGVSINGSSSISVLLGPLYLPDMLLRPQLVTRPEPGRVVFAEYHRWAGDLRANVERVLLQNLSDRLDGGVIIPVGSNRTDTDYRVSIRFQRFDGTLGQVAVLDGTWQLKKGVSGCLAGVYRFTIEVPVKGQDYGAYVRGLDKALALLSDRIAHTLGSQPGCHDNKASHAAL